MRRSLFFFVVFLALYGNDRLMAQSFPPGETSKDGPTRMLRIYEDNDCFNIPGQGTDDAYTNGTRIDLFYLSRHPAKGFINRAMPKAGDSSINIYGWGILQLMYTPDNLDLPSYQPNDYPWSGALLAAHTLYSYNPVKKYDLQTELLLGVIGPASLASGTQILIHQLEQYPRPMGWDHQFQNDLLLNINFTAEKQIASWGSAVEVIGGGQLSCGTMLNGLAVYPLIRIGLMNDYFRGTLSQYTTSGSSGPDHRRKWQAYFVLKPEAQWVLTDALLEGGVFTGNPNTRKDKGSGRPSPLPYHALRGTVYSMNCGAVISSGNFSVSYTQNASSAMMKGLYNHDVGNITLSLGW
ncbi:MAG TPA: lipid A deacylase LpxR family protein [Puia sp.]|jgi:hypothetical protein